MIETARELEHMLSKYEIELRILHEEEFSKKPLPEKWSKKEELGHLVDSAHNNLRRFIVAQYEPAPKIVYEQDIWVRIQHHQQMNSLDLISLWALLNGQIVRVLSTMPEDSLEKFCDTGKDKEELHTLDWLGQDYLKHMLHHLHHILEFEPYGYP